MGKGFAAEGHSSYPFELCPSILSADFNRLGEQLSIASQDRIRILHMYQVLRKHSDAEHPLTTNQIRALMEKEHGISMHRTTVPGDIEVLKSAGFNVVGRRARQNKYYLAEGDFELAELKILIDAVESSRFITEKKSGELIEKLSALTSEQNAKKLRRHIITTGRVRSLNESPV